MSRETMTHLNTQTLIGYTSKRGKAWHYRASDQGAEPNHYELGVPVADVRRRLFDWHAVEGTITATAVTDDGVLTSGEDPTRKAIMRSDTGAILGIFKQGYRAHQYDEWLIHYVENILDANLQIGSAGLLKGGAVAWVQVEMPETVGAAEGVEFRPFLTAATSLDGSLATTYIQGAQVVVCDNTLSVALAGATDKVRIKHSARSLERLGDVRAALGIVHQVADAFQAQVAELTAQYVSDEKWNEFVKAYVGGDKALTSPRSQSMAERKRGELNRLWNYDERVAPWKNNAYGVLAAVNTHVHHVQTVRGASRAERNMTRVVDGKVDALDANTLRVLATV